MWKNQDKGILTSQSFDEPPKQEEVDTIAMITDLQNQLTALENRVKQLERQNDN